VVVTITHGEGSASVNYVITPGRGTAGGKAEGTISTVRYELIPPQKVVLASGTSERSSQVFFKLHPANGFTIQEQRNYSILLEVPSAWEGDFLVITCKCQARNIGRLFTDEATVLHGYFAVGLYLQGCKKAKDLADEVSELEQKLGFVEWNNRFRPVLTYKSWYTWLFGTSEAIDQEQFAQFLADAERFLVTDREVALVARDSGTGSGANGRNDLAITVVRQMVYDRVRANASLVERTAINKLIEKIFGEKPTSDNTEKNAPTLRQRGEVLASLAKLRSHNGKSYGRRDNPSIEPARPSEERE
jgi:hypothetical protein